MTLGKKIHPSYIEIIKQLSSEDATVFNVLVGYVLIEEVGFAMDCVSFIGFEEQMNVQVYDLPLALFYLDNNKAYFMEGSTRDSLLFLYRLGLIYKKKSVLKKY